MMRSAAAFLVIFASISSVAFVETIAAQDTDNLNVLVSEIADRILASDTMLQDRGLISVKENVLSGAEIWINR